jgi:hypothetical protein
MLFFSKIRNTQKVVFVKVADLALLQATEDEVRFDLLGTSENTLYWQVFKTKILVFHVF